MRAELATRFAAAANDAALWLPPALRESIVFAGQLEGELPEVLLAHYTDRMPAERREQLDARVPDACHALLRRPLDLAHLPRLRAALAGVHAALAEVALDPGLLFGAATPTPEQLVAAQPTLEALYAPTLFGSGVPMLGAYRHQRAMLTAELDAGHDADALLDLRLSGHIVHELCHGRQYATAGPPPPWMVVESAVVELGRVALEAHVLPSAPGEAVAGVALFALLGGGLARRFGRRALWRILGEPHAFATEFGPRAAAVLAVAGWQDWRRRREPPFARDALEAVAWVKLADACLAAPEDRDPRITLISRATELDPLVAPRELPDVLHTAAAIPWSALPWWSETADARDDALVATNVRSLFAVHRFTRTFETVPDELPDGRLMLEVEACELHAAPRPAGIFVEPARALFPPPLARRLHARGARRIVADGVTRADASAVASALCELAAGAHTLDAESRLRFG